MICLFRLIFVYISLQEILNIHLTCNLGLPKNSTHQSYTDTPLEFLRRLKNNHTIF